MKIFACLFTLLFTAPVLAYGPDQASDRVWLTNVVIIAAENLGHIEKGSVLIENERIARVERNQNAKPPAGAVVVDGKGQ
ncbi:MAG TPA: hypothetical protein VFE61_23860 [Candidatus Sulfotelmatobacter sp.]|jgi:imidazolonepropionase-like amidohydrolase|nr:hypothetical protein [Candidatus Sulfotelmatobacter sp.]